jgi:hypothetical protein
MLNRKEIYFLQHPHLPLNIFAKPPRITKIGQMTETAAHVRMLRLPRRKTSPKITMSAGNTL